MQLLASLIPPAEALERALAVVAAVPPMSERSGDGRHRALRGRLLGRKRSKNAVPEGPMLNLLSTTGMQITLAKYGNVSQMDAEVLADRMEERAKEWPAPRLHLTGGTALEPEGDDSVWVGLGGDVDELVNLRNDIVAQAASLQLFVDRRHFRPEIQVGTINDLTTTTYLEAVLAELQAFQGEAWYQNRIALIVPGETPFGHRPFKVQHEIPLGPIVAH